MRGNAGATRTRASTTSIGTKCWNANDYTYKLVGGRVRALLRFSTSAMLIPCTGFCLNGA